MRPIDEIARKICDIGFRCIGCKDCCQHQDGEANLVMLGAAEVRQIMQATGMAWEAIAEPYPDYLENADGCRLTFGWCLRRTGRDCLFLDGERCSIYPHRPQICRTFPFFLEDGVPGFSECPGVGGPIDMDGARGIAKALIERSMFEDFEFNRIRVNYNSARFTPGRTVVIDSEGAKEIHG